MALVFTNYPLLVLCWVLCAVGVLLVPVFREKGHIFTILAGFFGAAGLFLSFVYGVPLIEILGLLLVMALLAGGGKGGRS